MNITRLCFMALLMALAQPAWAVDKASPQFGMVNGKCLGLSIGDQDFSSVCDTQLGRSMYTDGRTGLYFFLGQSHIITFSGHSTKNNPRDKTKLDTVKLDEVILNDGKGSKSGPQHIVADGSCDTTQKSDTLFLVNCHGALQKGTKFSASFEIDKSIP